MSDDSSSDEIMAPPERRAPSSRASKGNRMQKLIAEEHDEEEEAGEGDKEFYNQGFWADEDADDDFAADADDEDGRDSFDSDFGDSSASESDDDDDEEKAVRKEAKAKAKAAKKSVYKDPKLARKKGSGEASTSAAAAPSPKKSHKKRPRLEGEKAIQRGSLRASTQDATGRAEEKRKSDEAQAKARAERLEKAGKKHVELRRLTQEEILAEAKQTEIINSASLESMLRQAEQKRFVAVRERDTSGPRIRYMSRRVGDSSTGYAVHNTVTFMETPIPPCIDDIAPPYPAPTRCVVTNAPAKYFDPSTGCAYATLEAFRMLRGRTGRRQHSFGGGAGPSSAPAGPAAADD